MVLAASFVYGVACNYMAILGYFLLNQNFSVSIPILKIKYNSWRAYLLACGLPSLLCVFGLIFVPESPKFLFAKVSQAFD
jgi:MFS transporter, VNT family, synaptic vesicle glycoprotein 2